MRPIPTILLILAMGVVAAAVLVGRTTQQPPTESVATAPDSPALPERIYFLRDIDPQDGPIALLFGSLATGGDPLIVTDQAVIAAERNTAFFTNDTNAELRLMFFSVLTLSPPANSMSSTFVTLFQNGSEIGALRCFRLHCQDSNLGGAPHERNIAALLDAGKPAEYQSLLTADLTAYRDRIAEIEADPEKLFLGNRPDPTQATPPYPGHWQVVFPSQSWLAEGNPGWVPFDADARAATYQAWLTATLAPFGDSVSIGPVTVVRNPDQLFVVPNGDHPHLTPVPPSTAVELTPVDTFGFSARVQGPLDAQAALRAASADAFPTATDGPGVEAAFQAFITAQRGAPCPDCYRIVATGFASDSYVGMYETNQFFFSWYQPKSADD